MKKNIFKDFIHFFSYNRTERYGIIALLFALFVLIVLPLFLKQDSNRNDQLFKQYLSDVNVFESQTKLMKDTFYVSSQYDFQQMDKTMAQSKLSPFLFNPNNLSEELWKKMGLKEWQIKVIKNYESKGGKFRSKEDLKKMYCLKPSEYEILEPFILIPEVQKSAIKEKQEKVVIGKPLIEINTADSATLTTLYGIGPTYAKRIIKYRNLLGGFYDKNQLIEVYGFTQEKLDLIEKSITVNQNIIQKININQVNTKDLQKHPYLDYYTAKAIVDRRISKGDYTSINQLKEIDLIHDDIFEKISNYLKIN